MENHIFADGIGRISVMGGIVRLDLMTYSATEKDAGGQPRAVVNQRVVMGTESFLRVAEQIQEAAQQLLRAKPQAPKKAEAPLPAPQPQAAPAQVEIPQPPAPPYAAPVNPAPAAMPSPWTKPLVPRSPFP